MQTRGNRLPRAIETPGPREARVLRIIRGCLPMYTDITMIFVDTVPKMRPEALESGGKTTLCRASKRCHGSALQGASCPKVETLASHALGCAPERMEDCREIELLLQNTVPQIETYNSHRKLD